MPHEDQHIAHLNSVIDFLKVARFAAQRGYMQAIEELGNEGDRRGKDWSEAYEFLKARAIELMKD